MANPELGTTRATFVATIHRTKNRLVAVPASVQRELGLTRRPDNDILLVSIRKARMGRWNHHYVKLTHDAEFGIPADVTHLRGGERIEVKVHAVYAGSPRPSGGAHVLVELARKSRPWRRDGSANLDDYLSREARGR